MPIVMSISINGSVGARGRNQADDVRVVQRQLNGQMNPPRKLLTVDGKSGPKTESMIRDFQRSVCKFRTCDGRVDPGGKTLARLNDPASEGVWAGMSMAPANAQPKPTGGGNSGTEVPEPQLPQQSQTAFKNVYKAVHDRKALASDKKAESVVAAFLDHFVNNSLKDAKTVHAVLDLMNTALQNGKFLELARGLRILSDLNYGNPEAVCRSLADLARQQGTGKTMRALAAAGRNPSLGRVLQSAGRVAAAVGILFCLIESWNHYNKGRYGAALKEIYKGVGALAVLPLAVVDAIVTAWQGLDPGIENRRDASVFFEILRHGNILDHGGNAIDAAATIIEVCVKAVVQGKMDWPTLDALVERMRSSSGKNFVELGEFLGDWYYDRLMDAKATGEEIGDYIGREYGAHLLPIIRFFDL